MKRVIDDYPEIPFNPSYSGPSIGYVDLSESSEPMAIDDAPSLFQDMPARRKSTVASRRKSYGGTRISSSAAAVARYVDEQIKAENAAASWKRAQEIAPKFAAYAKPEDYTRKRLRGRGAYSFGDFEALGDRFLKKGVPNLLSAAGQVRKFFGRGRYGGQSGSGAEGSGSYSMDNSLIMGGRRAPNITAANDETDTLTISDCEFVKDIFAPLITTSSSGFGSQNIPVNPGLSGFAPNLSQIAGNYTEYTIHQLVYELRPVISESNVNNGQTGTAMMVFNYNANEDPYENKEDVMQAHGSVSGRVVDEIKCGVECDPEKTNKTKFFVRTGPVPYSKDSDEYDHGVLTVCTNNIPKEFSNQQLFELWVHYTIELRKRKAGALRLNNQQRDLFVCNGNVTFATGVPNTQFVTDSTGVLKAQQSNLGVFLDGMKDPLTGVQNAGTSGVWKMTFLPETNGLFEVRLLLEGTSIPSGLVKALTVDGNVITVKDLYATGATTGDSSDNPSYIVSSHTTTQLMVVGHVKVKSATGSKDNTVTITLTDYTGASCTQWQLEIIEYTNSFAQSKANPAPILMNVTSGDKTG